METQDMTQKAKTSDYERDLQELMELASRPDSDPQKLQSFLRVQELIAAYKPEAVQRIFDGLFQRADRIQQHAGLVILRIKELLPPRSNPLSESPDERTERLYVFRLLQEISRVHGFAAVGVLGERCAFPESRDPMNVIREIPKQPSTTPPGGKAPMYEPNIGGLQD